MTTDPSPYLFWITSRAAGFAALVLASLAVSLGLLMSTKLLRGRTTELRTAHDTLALSTLVAIVVHGVALLFDSYVHYSILDIAIPFLASYKTLWTSIGIVAGWGLALLGLSYYARRWVGAVRWRKLHRFIAVAWLAGLVHSLGEGTDAGQVWFLAMVGLVAIPALGLLVTRLSRSAGAAGPARPASEPHISKNRPSGPTLTTGVVPIAASRPQH